ncbi:MAG: ABC transporter permease subunit [Spirochaetota bacterium]
MKREIAAWLSFLVLGGILLAGTLTTDPAIDLAKAFSPPASEYWLGSTPLGQSVATLVLTGAVSTVALSAGALLLALLTAFSCTGLLYLLPPPARQIYAGLIDAWLAIPGIFIALSIGYFLPQGFFSVMAALVLSEFAPLQKFLLQRLAGIAQAEYITMASVMGAPATHRLRLHVMPRLGREAGFLFVVTLPSVALSLASLEFLGVQTGSERMSLGLQIAIYKDYIWLYPHLSLAPVVTLLITLFCLSGTSRLLRR